MKELTIEWRHYEKEGTTCDRCAATGTSVREVVSELGKELAGRGVTVTLIENVLPEELMAQSNMLLFNGVPLEAILDNAAADENPCPSCSCLTGSETSCRTVQYQGKTYEEIPAELIRKAAHKVLGLNQA
ncbi:MAG: molybdenum cofactor biosysynthesis protein [Geobacteraceae bacterium GWC2_58_44]|nr:MAG: molybdenum cofactor biosysynthesis protein [Geobacteraceae bacterium GWC2_58_44]